VTHPALLDAKTGEHELSVKFGRVGFDPVVLDLSKALGR